MEHFVQAVVKNEISTILIYVLVLALAYYGGSKLIQKYEDDNKMHQQANWNLSHHLNHLGDLVRGSKHDEKNLFDLAWSNQRKIRNLQDMYDEQHDDESSTSSVSSVSTEDEAVNVDIPPV